jgi:predicted nuclease of restriction endonuclease-like (RecB) superfamily
MSKKKELINQEKSIDVLFGSIQKIIETARQNVSVAVNTAMVEAYWHIGRMIVEEEQKGEKRAQYGKQIISELAARLISEFGKGFSERNLRNMRSFYRVYKDRMPAIRQNDSAKSSEKEVKSAGISFWQNSSAKFDAPFMLSWSHYVFLCGIDDADERNFYEIEASVNGWKLEEVKRQFNTGLYERLALSRNKKQILELAEKGHIIKTASDLKKEPLVLEFLGLDEKHEYSESDLETAIIDKLEHFLLELGKGFLFEARQKRFTFDEEHFFIDLVFYNRLLRCYVLIDLKIGKLTHQDLGQMQMYVNYFDRFVKLEDETPTIGIILCKKKSDAVVEITLPQKSNIRASEYKLYLPSKKLLKEKLIAWVEQQEENCSHRSKRT